jgi:hypothetical protein
MGYRLEISKIIDADFGGTKLFGYAEDEHELKSYQWLLQKGYIKGDEVWTYGFDPQIILTRREFAEFINLYWEDLQNYAPGWVMPQSLKDLIEEDCSKLLTWG